MTAETKSVLDPDDLRIAVAKACGLYLRPVETTHQLIEPGEDSAVVEFYSERDETRFLAVQQGSEIAKWHIELLEKKLPVFSGIYRDELLLMHVPAGTKTVTSLLPAVARDPVSYSSLFFELGRTLKTVNDETAKLPLPAGRQPFLDSVAFVFDDTVPQGGRLFLVPPYNLDDNLKLDDVQTFVGVDLASMEIFDPASAQLLADRLTEGWHAIG